MPMLPEYIDELPKVGMGVLGAAWGGTLLWKLYFIVRKEKREDRSGQDTQNGYAHLLEKIQEVSKQQGEIIRQQGERIEDLGNKLDDEIARRREAEEENALFRQENSQFRRRIKHLEDVVKRLGGTV